MIFQPAHMWQPDLALIDPFMVGSQQGIPALIKKKYVYKL
jgi:hypothetical protein